jgi:DNA-binding Lrp family transcriptional regulator
LPPCRTHVAAVAHTLIYDPHFRNGERALTAIGFVLIDIEPTREKEVYAKLMKIGQIVELYPLFGEYDLIAKVEADSYDAIGAVVMSNIRSIEGVKATKTLARVAF